MDVGVIVRARCFYIGEAKIKWIGNGLENGRKNGSKQYFISAWQWLTGRLTGIIICLIWFFKKNINKILKSTAFS